MYFNRDRKPQHLLSPYHLGVVLMLLGAMLFATKAIFIKLAYQYEVSSISLLALRMAFSLPFFLGIGYWQSRRDASRIALSWKERIGIILLGLIGYYLASYLDFLGLQYLTAGMERLILFVYPTLVLLLGFWWLGRRIEPLQWAATLLTYLGIAIAFSGSEWSWGNDFTKGAILVFGSAFTFAIFVIGSGELTPRLGSVRFTSFALSAAAIGVLTHALVEAAPLLGLAPAVYAYGFAIAIIATVLPSYATNEGIRRIGAGNAAILGAIGPVTTILLEYWVLGESLDGLQWIGGLLVILGVVLIGSQKKSSRSLSK